MVRMYIYVFNLSLLLIVTNIIPQSHQFDQYQYIKQPSYETFYDKDRSGTYDPYRSQYNNLYNPFNYKTIIPFIPEVQKSDLAELQAIELKKSKDPDDLYWGNN
jgi:hypothetical protein